ncbi:MAG: glycoside hydrolase [Actinobacteria bacterium]|nr:MAG: glycoside hydrolase [Actinomycetota bacterium]
MRTGRYRLGGLGTALFLCAAVVTVATGTARASAPTTAWRAGAFSVNVPNLVRRADVVLGAPNAKPEQAMPVGNGVLGAAVWAAGGFTAQLNRSDTQPLRWSPGWLTIPGLARLTGAADFAAHLDLYDATLVESGGGMTATIYLRADKDELVVDVTGAPPGTAQTAQVQLWSGRSPKAQTAGAVGLLAQTWKDDTNPGAGGGTFGALAAVTAGGRNVKASIVDSRTVRVSFTPNSDGSFRVVAVAPHWTGGDAAGTASALIGADAGGSGRAGHLAWWHAYWGRVGLVKLSSADGVADYLENLRTLYLYDAAADSRDTYPGSQAGVADLFSPYQDEHRWDAAAYWHWNLRMYVQANLSAGAFDLNAPYFRLYQRNLSAIEAWTKAHMGSRYSGICVPETMRFNGQGYEFGTGYTDGKLNCDTAYQPYYNARTITTGAEVGLWVWQQYLMTGDRGFLTTNYPLMAQAARFLLSYATTGTDGKLHTFPSNAHETQWDVHDPTTDAAAMQALFPATVKAAQLLGQDATLVSQLNAAIPKIRALPRTDAATQTKLLTPADDAAGQDVIGLSQDPAATRHNVENVGLEPVWPYNLIGDSGGLSALAKRTYDNRPNRTKNDWSYDPLDAARLGLGSQVAATLTTLTTQYQKRPSGLANFIGMDAYAEQQGVVAAALGEALVQDYDGLLRIAPALPSGWDADATVFIQGGSRVSIQVHGGVLTTVGVTAGSTATMRIRNPWPGKQIEVVDGADESTVVLAPTSAGTVSLHATAGRTYLVQLVSSPVAGMAFAGVNASPATRARQLGTVTIGIP